MSNNHRASIISRPLFIKVAESMVILEPIFQFGCCNAWAGFTSRICSRDSSHRGPPDAVRIRRRMSSRRCPSMDWKMALCSLSTGKILTPWRRASSCIKWPAITIGSLFARATCFLARIAARVGTNPAPPTIAEMTSAASGSSATCATPSRPDRISTGRSLQRARSLAAAAWSASATT